MDQSISGPIISFLTFEEPSSHFCGDGAGAVWQFHHTEAFLPFPRASTTPDQGSGHSWDCIRKLQLIAQRVFTDTPLDQYGRFDLIRDWSRAR